MTDQADAHEYPTPEEIIEIHRRALERFGGRPGIRDRDAVAAVLARPEQHRAYAARACTLGTLAAALAAGFCRIRHPFIDGNKRVAFAAAVYMLYLNGDDLDDTEHDATRMVLGLSSGDIDEATFAAWVDANRVPLMPEDETR